MATLLNLKEIARRRVETKSTTLDEFGEFLKLWWSNKYNLPTNHPLLMGLTIEELAVEYFTYLFSHDQKALDEYKNEIGIGSANSDEKWFKEAMADDYKPENDYSTDYKLQNTVQSLGDERKIAENSELNKTVWEDSF